MNKIEQIDEDLLKVNPFSFSLKIPVTEIMKSGEFKKVEDEELSEGVILNATYYVERTQSTKIYHCENCKQMIYDLSPKAQRMYLYVLYNLKRGKDWIQINKENYMTKNNITAKNTVNDAIKELTRFGFIAPTVEYKSAYWINPTLFFSGNRLNKFPSNKEVKQSFFSSEVKSFKR